MSTLSDSLERKARKDHVCCHCGQTIPRGSVYFSEQAGLYQVNRWHLDCADRHCWTRQEQRRILQDLEPDDEDVEQLKAELAGLEAGQDQEGNATHDRKADS